MVKVAEKKAIERVFTVRVMFVLIGAIILLKAFHLQVLDTKFQVNAEAAGTGIVTEYPPRGTLYDRYGEPMVADQPIYDLEITYNQYAKHQERFDIAEFCRLLKIDRAYFDANIEQNWRSDRFSKNKPFVFLGKISPEQYAAFQEKQFQFPGVSIIERKARDYPHAHAAHLFGYLSEASPAVVDTSEHGVYVAGDYLGSSGLEKQYELVLRGRKGARTVLKDQLGREVGLLNGDGNRQPPVPGTHLTTTIDLELQIYGEQLLANKMGGIVAIEPKTGEVLAMISAPGYDPNDLKIGRSRAEAFARLNTDSLKPLLNRAVQGQYPPGSLFKPIVALVGMQEGTLTPDRGIGCAGGFYSGGAKTGCHNHAYCGDVPTAIQHSCNAYFVTAFLETINPTYARETPRAGLDKFNAYLRQFGLGQKLGLDFPAEVSGSIPTTAFYDQRFSKEPGGWRAMWIRSLGIGQGEYMMTNLQIANLAAAIANQGYWMTPHLVRAYGNPNDNLPDEALTFERHDISIDQRYFEIVTEGMDRVVMAGTGRRAAIPGIKMCGKTGTAENPHGDDHSIFFAFAPRENPQIAIAVYVENATWGSTYAAPIASLMIEKYINRQIAKERKPLEERMLKGNLISQP